MRLRISACGGVFAVDGQVVWDDYLDQRQHVLGTDSDEVLRWFIRWRDRDSVPDRLRHRVDVLLANDILIAEGSQRDAQEQAVLHAWGRWGPVARAYHYSTRTTRATRFRSSDEPARDCAPEPASSFRDTKRIALPTAEEAQWQHRDLLDVLYLRRSHREFGAGPVPLTSLGALLQASAGTVRVEERSGAVFKTAPSGGGRHPTELYPVVRDVEGLPPGIYHYDSRTHELALLGGLVGDAELVAACGDQRWVTGAGLVVFYTSVFGRNMWKHDSPRTYRVLQLDAGHMNQNLTLLATALGLRTTFTAAIRDELVEELIGCDPATELAIGCAVVGT
jgi:SagB-type dehydrogenase family enzyme